MSERDPLDQALASLPKSIAPPPDLWARVQAELEPSAPASGRALRWNGWMQLAAGVLLVLATAMTTFVVTRQTLTQPMIAQTPAPLLNAMPASFGAEQLGPEYLQARESLHTEFEQRIASLPPASRAKLERDLADLRRAAQEIAATLAEHPSDPLLQELLLSTYQSELQLFASVNDMTTRTTRVEL